jgi:hypothetical protein
METVTSYACSCLKGAVFGKLMPLRVDYNRWRIEQFSNNFSSRSRED